MDIRFRQIAGLRRALRARMETLYEDRLVEVYLYGSYARGEAHGESDIDVVVVLRNVESVLAELKQLGPIAVDMLNRYDEVVSFVVMTEEEYQQTNFNFHQNVRDEGVPL